MLAFVVAAALWQRRRHGDVARIDFSMIEAMLWTMADPLLQTQGGAPAVPLGNRSEHHMVHDAFRCAGNDAWISVAVEREDELRRLRSLLAGQDLASWLKDRDAVDAERSLRDAGVAASALADASSLAASDHLRQRGFWEAYGDGLLPGLPWRSSFGRQSGQAPGLGADTDVVLAEVLGLSRGEIDGLHQSGALGPPRLDG
jgi:crotonobetainyl-CoA:carnitine CoA-transferase CaiB-like acyl-CoA transferase